MIAILIGVFVEGSSFFVSLKKIYPKLFKKIKEKAKEVKATSLNQRPA